MEVKAGYKQTEVGVIPEDWQIEPILGCCDYADYRGKTPPKTASGTFLVTARNVRKGFIDYDESQEYVPTALYEQIMQRGKPCIGDVVITTEAPLGNVAQVDREDVALAQRIIKYRPKNSSLSADYLKHYLLSDRFQQILNDHSSGSTAKGIKGSVLHQLPVVIPPPPEQRAIAEALRDADALIKSLEQLLAKKRQLKQGAMQELLTGKRRLPGFSGEWEVKRLGELADIRSGGTPSTTQAQFWNGFVPWCTPTDVTGLNGFKYLRDTSRKISHLGLKSSSAEMIPASSVLMTSRATIGECAINQVPVTTNQGFKNFVPSENADVEFLYYLLTTQRQGFISLCGGSTFLEIGKTQLTAYEVRVPTTKTEQIAIAAVLSDMDAEIAALEERLAKARALKQGMMQELLTGRIRLV